MEGIGLSTGFSRRFDPLVAGDGRAYKKVPILQALKTCCGGAQAVAIPHRYGVRSDAAIDR